MNEPIQLRLVREVFPQFRREYEELPSTPLADPAQFYLGNNVFDGTDALSLYCMIRWLQPSKIIEVGSGHSSRLAAQAARANGKTELVCIEPNPDPILVNGFPGLSELIAVDVQEVDPRRFDELDDGDILFIDSSHVVKAGSDVNYLILDVLPRVRPGVVVHLHDVFLPQHYPRSWLIDQLWFWSEQYLLQAFLAFNNAFEVLLSTAYLGLRHVEDLQATFPKSPWWNHGGSLWMCRTPLAKVAELASPPGRLSRSR